VREAESLVFELLLVEEELLVKFQALLPNLFDLLLKLLQVPHILHVHTRVCLLLIEI